VPTSHCLSLSGSRFNFHGTRLTPGTFSPASYASQPQPDNCTNATLGAGQTCTITMVFIPTSSSQAARNANLVVNAGGLSQTVSLTGHDSIATIAVSPATQTTPPMNPTPASTVAITGTITVTNTSTRCDAATATAAVCPRTGIPAGYPAVSVDAG